MKNADPLIPGGTNRRTSRVKFGGANIQITPLPARMLMFACLALVGLVIAARVVLELVSEVGEFPVALSIFALITIVAGFVPVARAEWLVLSGQGIWRKSLFGSKKRLGSESDGPAGIEMIVKSVHAVDATRPFACAEVNLLFQSGNRVNLFQDANLARAEKQAGAIAARLGVTLATHES